jgi:hypothetical protein
MGNTCKSSKTDSTIQAIAEPPIPIVKQTPSEEISTTTITTTTTVREHANDLTIHEEKEEEEV